MAIQTLIYPCHQDYAAGKEKGKGTGKAGERERGKCPPSVFLTQQILHSNGV